MDEPVKTVFDSPGFAAEYERKTGKAEWAGPEVLFGLAFRHVRAGEMLLDLGIGTGLCSELFHRAGLRVHGLDFSREMLKIAAAKQFATELVEHDLTRMPYPFADGAMDHAVCGGVLHIFADPAPLFSETARMIRRDGIFAFTCLDCDGDSPVEPVEHGGHLIYRHSLGYIRERLAQCGLQMVKTLRFQAEFHGEKQSVRAYAVNKQ